MASPATSSCLLFLLALLLPLLAEAVPRRLRFPSLELASFNASEPPSTFFEVDRPIRPPRGSVGPCSALLISGSFGYTYGRPPSTAAYAPPECLATARGRGRSVALAVLEWSADRRGRQFDRIFGVWLSGAELLRSCTAEPRPNGILWSVSRDITRYAALLSEPGEIAVYLGNIVDRTYTGFYHANLTLHLYFDSGPPPPPQQQADLILPISRSLPLYDGQWFAIQSSTDVQSKKLAIPSNTYRAVLEVFVSFHGSDEFWYTNPPNEYIEANNLSGLPGNGAFREIIVKVDEDIVGAVWPFTVIYTGGVNPLLWRPITGVGSFNLPTYDIDITPFLGKLLDGKEHDFGFGVTNALDMWYIDANLHLWLDHKSGKTTGGLVSYNAAASEHVQSEFSGLNGQFVTTASRHVSATGWVESSHGKVMTTFDQRFSYENSNVYSKSGSVQAVNQTIDTKSGVSATIGGTVLLSEEVHQVFPLYLFDGTSDEVGDKYSLVSVVKLGINEKKRQQGFSNSSLQNVQSARGSMRVKKNLVISGSGENHQVYRYVGTDGCYFRDVSSKNYTVVLDHSDGSCLETPRDVGSCSLES
uniref:Uncharacterized protein n=1 Tax=Avena sativa TaxID=4498 RepID=A0ACD5VNC7_AVESA